MSFIIPVDTSWRSRGEEKKNRHDLKYSTSFFGLRSHLVQLIPAEAASKVRWNKDDIKSSLKLEKGFLFTSS